MPKKELLLWAPRATGHPTRAQARVGKRGVGTRQDFPIDLHACARVGKAKSAVLARQCFRKGLHVRARSGKKRIVSAGPSSEALATLRQTVRQRSPE